MGNIQQDKDTLNNSPFLYEQPFAVGGHVKCCIQNLKGSTSYATGGDTLNASSLGLGPKGLILFADISMTYSGTYFVRAVYPQRGPASTIKLIFHKVSDGTEPTAATDLSAEKFRIKVFGIQ